MKFLLKTQRKVEFHSLDTKQSHSQNQNKSFTNNSYVCGTAAGHGGGDNRQPGDGEINKNKQSEKSIFPCLACNTDGVTDLRSTQHYMGSCDIWNSFSINDKEKRVKCRKHPFATNHTNDSCSRSIGNCRICSETSHHVLLCPKRLIKSSTNVAKVSASSLSTQSDNPMLPVMVQAQFVTGLNGSTI